MRHKLLSGIGAAVVVIIVIAAAASGGSDGDGDEQATGNTTTSTSDASATADGTTAESSGLQSEGGSAENANDQDTDSGEPSTSADATLESAAGAKESAEASDDAQPAPAEPRTRDNSSAKKVTLGAGSFLVGDDITPGRYVITAAQGESGNLTGSSDDDPVTINEILGDAGGLGVPSVTTDLEDGEEVKISGMSSVTFTPAETKLRTSLTTGDWVVGLDIKPGRYVATPADGESGNFFVYDENGFPDTNEILGGEDGLGVPEVNVSLDEGQTVSISGISEVTFAAK